jgi:hypothetical protein
LWHVDVGKDAHCTAVHASPCLILPNATLLNATLPNATLLNATLLNATADLVAWSCFVLSIVMTFSQD